QPIRAISHGNTIRSKRDPLDGSALRPTTRTATETAFRHATSRSPAQVLRPALRDEARWARLLEYWSPSRTAIKTGQREKRPCHGGVTWLIGMCQVRSGSVRI